MTGVEGTDVAAAWTLCRGLGKLAEPKRGYRFGVENHGFPDVLARLYEPPPQLRVLDLGSGCGVLGLFAGAALPALGGEVKRVTLVERDPDLAAFARFNAGRSPLPVHVVEGDLREVALSEHDLVVANPPFFAPGHGRDSRMDHKRFATHAHFGAVGAFISAARRVLTGSGTSLALSGT